MQFIKETFSPLYERLYAHVGRVCVCAVKYRKDVLKPSDFPGYWISITGKKITLQAHIFVCNHKHRKHKNKTTYKKVESKNTHDEASFRTTDSETTAGSNVVHSAAWFLTNLPDGCCLSGVCHSTSWLPVCVSYHLFAGPPTPLTGNVC